LLEFQDENVNLVSRAAVCVPYFAAVQRGKNAPEDQQTSFKSLQDRKGASAERALSRELSQQFAKDHEFAILRDLRLLGFPPLAEPETD